jgi:hypothetical protein
MPETSTAVATTAPQQRKPVALAGPQNDLDTAYRLAQNLAASNLIPQDLKGKPSDVLVILLYGQELGLAPMQAIQTIDVMKGRPQLRANLWVALTRKAGHKARVIEESETSCTFRIIRHDDPEPHIVTYTLDDAKKAGLLGNSNYTKNPKAMLYARAASTCCRRACPEVALGFSDEYELAEDEQQSPTLAQVAAQREDQPTTTAAQPPSAQEDDAMLAEIAAIEAEHAPQAEPVDAELADEPVDALWAEGGAR